MDNQTPQSEQPGQVIDPSNSAKQPPVTPAASASTTPPPTNTAPPAPSEPTKQYAIPTPTSTELSKPDKKFSKSLLIALLAVIILGAGAAFAYVGVVLPNKPENILSKAATNLITASSLKFSGQLELTSADAPLSRPVEFSGSSDVTDPTNVKAEATVTIPTPITTVTTSVRMLDDYAYVKLDGLSGLDTLLGAYGDSFSSSSISNLIKSVNGSWYEFDLATLGGSTGISTLPDVGTIDIQAQTDAYEANPFVVLVDKLADEKVDNVDSYHFMVRIDKDALKAMVQSLQDSKSDELKLPSDEFNSLTDLIDGMNDSSQAEVWINKSDKTINQIKLSSGQGSDAFTLIIQLSNYNQPLNIEKPQNTKTLLELMGEVAPLINEFRTSQPDLFQLQSGQSPSAELIPSVLGAFEQL